MSKRWMTGSVLGAVAAAGLGFAGARALATGAPQLSPLTYGGVLTDKDGKPYPAAQEVVIKFYDKVDATAAKCVAPGVLAEAGTGRFSVVLPGECAQAVRDTPDLWSEATVGGGKTVLPRVHVGAVPYALEADSAKVAAGATGALKAAMDGVAADVAALKLAPAGGGGGPKVVDGAGVFLGWAPEVNDSYFYVFTKSGNYLVLAPSGVSVQKAVIYYLTPDCSGQPHRQAALGQTSNGIGAYAAEYADGWFAQPTWFVDVLPLSGFAKPLAATAKSRLNNGKCMPESSNSNFFAMAQRTNAQIGLPDKIAAPLKVVP